jgi:ATP-dependent Lhr-like helicase
MPAGLRMTRANGMQGFHEATRRWFLSNFKSPTAAQVEDWEPITGGASTLLLAPTGSGKTLAAFMCATDKILFSPPPAREARCRVLYVSPIKALTTDIERNLRAPLAGIYEAARSLGLPFHEARVAIRTGDTSAKDRVAIGKTPPDILLTTPESLSLMLTSGAREVLAHVDTVIIDEIHSIAASKRGAHFFLALERLEALRGDAPLQRIGLSATQKPLSEIARLLGGLDPTGQPRPVVTVDVHKQRKLQLEVCMPEPTLAAGISMEASDGANGSRRPSQWDGIIPRLVELIRTHKSTMVFVNSRRLAERIAQDINDHAGAPLALAHHGSLAREERSKAEDQLKRGELPCVVATASLELGLDIGAVDLVIQIESPPSVAAGLQRIGRSNHEVGGVPHGVIMPKHKGDLVAAAAAVSRMRTIEVEASRYPRNPLDVLAQHIVAMVAMDSWPTEVLFERVRQCANFADLPRSSFDGVLDMLSGRSPSTEFSDLRPRLVWDRVRNVLRPRKGTRLLAVTNVGTIPERGLYTVVLDDGAETKKSRRVGELDEEMVFELREGEVVLLGASSWRVQRITHERVFVTPAPGEPGKMPFWHGDSPGRSPEFGATIGALTREISKKGLGALKSDLDEDAQAQLLQYLADQAEQGLVPTDRLIVVERMRDELGDYRVCFLSPYGKRVHTPLAMCLRDKARALLSVDIEPIAMDDGIAMRFPDLGTPPDLQALLPRPEEVHDVLVRALGDSSLFAARFREGGRVAPGRCLPGAPTDPDVQISRIRLFETRLRYATRTADGCRSG